MIDPTTVFPKRHTLFVVVHCQTPEQTLQNVEIAQGEGADGVFLINPRIASSELIVCFMKTCQYYPTLWVGLNFLGTSPVNALRRVRLPLATLPSGLWMDNIGFKEYDNDPCKSISGLRFLQNHLDMQDVLIFGSIAFKYQGAINDVGHAATLVAQHVDVVVTSGEATGQAPDPEKIKLMKNAVEDTPLAIASGITPGNVELFMPYADYFMVATGISKPNTDDLDPKLVRELANIINA